MNVTPRVSVLMSVYNGEAFVAEAVESILTQTFQDFEFLIVDDGSTDRSARILADYAGHDPRIRVLSQQNRGLIASLNRGLNEAQGVYIARMDADDVALPERLALQVTFLDANPSVAALGGAIELIDERGQSIRIVDYPTLPDDVRTEMIKGCPLAHPAVTMRADLVRSLGGYRPAFRHAEDYDLWLRLDEKADIANLPEVVLRYRIHDRKVSSVHALAQREATIVAKHAAECRRRGLPDPTESASELSGEFLARFRSIAGQAAYAQLLNELLGVTIARMATAGDFAGASAVLRAVRQSPPTGYDRDFAIAHLVRASLSCLRAGRMGQACSIATRALRLFPCRTPALVVARLASRGHRLLRRWIGQLVQVARSHAKRQAER